MLIMRSSLAAIFVLGLAAETAIAETTTLNLVERATTDAVTKTGKADETRDGTEVAFEPDPEIFGRFAWSEEFITDRLRYYAFLNAGLTLEYQGQRFVSQGGLADLLAHEMGGEEPLYPLVHCQADRLEFAFTHTELEPALRALLDKP